MPPLRWLLFAIIALLVPTLTLASGFDTPLTALRGTSSTPLPDAINAVATAFLVLTTIVALIVLVIAGAQYLLSQGDEERIEKSKKTLVGAVIGLLVIGLSGAGVNCVLGMINGRGCGGRGGSASVAVRDDGVRTLTLRDDESNEDESILNRINQWLGSAPQQRQAQQTPIGPECMYCRHWPVPECAGKNEAQCPDTVSALGQKECTFVKDIGCISEYEKECRNHMAFCQKNEKNRCAMGVQARVPANFDQCSHIDYKYEGHDNNLGCVRNVLPEIEMCVSIAANCSVNHYNTGCNAYANQELVNAALEDLKLKYPKHSFELTGNQSFSSIDCRMFSGRVTYRVRPNQCPIVNYDTCPELPNNICYKRAANNSIQCTDPFDPSQTTITSAYCCPTNEKYSDDNLVYRWQQGIPCPGQPSRTPIPSPRSSPQQPSRTPLPSPKPLCLCVGESVEDTTSTALCPDTHWDHNNERCNDYRYYNEEISKEECNAQNGNVITGWYRTESEEIKYGVGELRCIFI